MTIFENKPDYERFQKLLYTTNSKETSKLSALVNIPHRVWNIDRGETLVNIGSYSLMPNHFHLLIKAKGKDETALFLQRLQLSYSKYFNMKKNHTGTLFQGKAKAEHIYGDKYLKYLISYIHLNPIKLIQKDWKEKGVDNINLAKKYLNNYKYSSYIDFLGEKRNESKILELEAFPNYFPTSDKFEKEIFEWLNYNKNETFK